MCDAAQNDVSCKWIMAGTHERMQMARVLIIEDNPLNMKLAVLLLHNAGHTVLCAVDAENGLMLAHTQSPDLILMDFQLPGMDGRAATALLKHDPATSAIPVIALSATAHAGLITGCDAHVAKPLRYQALYAAINALLNKGAAQPAFTHKPPAKSSDYASAPAVDVGVLEGLVGSDQAVVLEFLDAFRSSAEKIVPELEAACASNQPLAAGRQAHMLKSAAYTIGAHALGGLCKEIEAAGKSGRVESLAALFALLEHEIKRVYAFLDAIQERRPDFNLSRVLSVTPASRR
jgi:CheY-like chemotaxis protein/HPt (histidine-containing phosphotransfer) domain-containing protein